MRDLVKTTTNSGPCRSGILSLAIKQAAGGIGVQIKLFGAVGD
jgi:hypothetical protein